MGLIQTCTYVTTRPEIPLSQSLKMCHSKDDLLHVFLPGGVTGRTIIFISLKYNVESHRVIPCLKKIKFYQNFYTTPVLAVS